MVDFQKAGQQKQKQQNHTDDAGRKGKGQILLDQNADTADGENNSHLFDDFHNTSPHLIQF